VRKDSSSNDTRTRPRLVESPNRVVGSIQDGIGQTSNSTGGSVTSIEKTKKKKQLLKMLRIVSFGRNCLKKIQS